ncbi:Methyltransferase, FkbM family [Roseibacterium elongatum DSM 19469]|uniref:Methyltransferase, FkbM family n=1 Tax=Roseicyclus elongatus DSM 19469 TaxID=1294273 RepID=W8RPH4_9RHOB|nr:FkbM family methyltransferase [Roseibacterium elongatum]AHM02898.1 Methyltransferase, FkbM family [Roseibacterium elongatum DSM 19469]
MTGDMQHSGRVGDTLAFHINGVDLVVPAGLASAEIVEKLRAGSYEADEARAADRCVKSGFRVLELGTGLGYVATLAAQRTAPEHVLSVEANPDLLPVIEGNLSRNGCSGVSLLHGAVAGQAEEDETVCFHISEGFTGSRLGARGGRQVEVPLIGFHDLIRAHRPHVVLMDVEGAEAGFFDRPWKCPLRFCAMELHPRQYGPATIKKIVDAMSAMGMTYDPVVSSRKILGFRKVWGEADTGA